MTEVKAQIAQLLANDPICMGRVCSGTVDAIAELVRPSPDIAELVEALRGLASAEAFYRSAHDLNGDGHRSTGRAWDLMRRAGDKARLALSRFGGPNDR